jgi:hypothetical protein
MRFIEQGYYIPRDSSDLQTLRTLREARHKSIPGKAYLYRSHKRKGTGCIKRILKKKREYITLVRMN